MTLPEAVGVPEAHKMYPTPRGRSSRMEIEKTQGGL